MITTYNSSTVIAQLNKRLIAYRDWLENVTFTCEHYTGEFKVDEPFSKSIEASLVKVHTIAESIAKLAPNVTMLKHVVNLSKTNYTKANVYYAQVVKRIEDLNPEINDICNGLNEHMCADDHVVPIHLLY